MKKIPHAKQVAKFLPLKCGFRLQLVLVEGEHKLSTLTFLGLEAISYARVLQNLKISCLVLKFIQIEEIL